MQQNMGSPSDMSLHNKSEYTTGVVCRTYMLSIRVADACVIRVGLVIVGKVLAARCT